MKYILLIPTFLSAMAFAGQNIKPQATSELPQLILAELDVLKKVKATIVSSDAQLKIGFAWLNEKQISQVRDHSHDNGACAGFESFGSVAPLELQSTTTKIFSDIKKVNAKNKSYKQKPLALKSINIKYKRDIKEAVEEVSTENLEEWVTWLSNFNTRYHRSANKNVHVAAMKERLMAMVADAGFPVEVSEISHERTGQRSLRVRFTGSTRPDEVVVLGGHFDSIVRYGGEGRSPGADDNASGSATVVEAMRIILKRGQPQRTLEFMWYAGEEGGLLGSREIAASYKNEGKNVVAALQLDMTMHPGSGVGLVSFIRDYTSDWLTEHLVELNRVYVNAKTEDSTCRYACSDHASWHRNGYPAVFPFEANTNDMNRKIHTPSDLINDQSSFEHVKVFAQLAVALGLDLGNSEAKQPY